MPNLRETTDFASGCSCGEDCGCFTDETPEIYGPGILEILYPEEVRVNGIKAQLNRHMLLVGK